MDEYESGEMTQSYSGWLEGKVYMLRRSMRDPDLVDDLRAEVKRLRRSLKSIHHCASVHVDYYPDLAQIIDIASGFDDNGV